MPPKAVRGGTGRGRGRGGGKVTAPDLRPDTPASDVEMTDVPEGQSTVDETFSPNSSPANVPTETPAPTPVRPAFGASSTAPTSRAESDAPPTGRAGPSLRGGRGGARGGAKAPSKFKPKAVRTDAAKLAELAKKEEARLAGIAATRAREEARAMRARGRPARGRGDVMGRMGRGGGGSGLFGAMPESISAHIQTIIKIQC